MISTQIVVCKDDFSLCFVFVSFHVDICSSHGIYFLFIDPLALNFCVQIWKHTCQSQFEVRIYHLISDI
jgi:hypothetical protein